MELIKYLLLVVMMVFIAGIVFGFLIKVGVALLILLGIVYIVRKLLFD